MVIDKHLFSRTVAEMAVCSLIEELELTPKPGLVDRKNTGAHKDLTFQLMTDSAQSLKNAFENIAFISFGRQPSQSLREEIAAIGRDGEAAMFAVTCGVNTHKGAIWSLGLLTSAISVGTGNYSVEEIVSTAGQLARFPDRQCPHTVTNGSKVITKYGVNGAKGEAQQGFPHIMKISFPMLIHSRSIGITEEKARLNALLSLIAHLDDTCILHRGGPEALLFAKKQAAACLATNDYCLLYMLDSEFISRNISPGGSADLLAATLFLNKIHLIHKGEEGLNEYQLKRKVEASV
ncbi:triphosphoribosyl-dephospho-CoA synthase [Bacillus sp. IB182487]|uniref:triphosphoribosyl-dephospho-CoA synthase n=2 Tax=Metabacillus arenae TaxID=2771434 RepID=A0A926NDB8_9BACI|nr:triphosphoribosyl-dephospho-CoA synthase [Metabacillus arenae]